METDTNKIALRKTLLSIMSSDGLSDYDMEEVEPELSYSRGIRTLCVFDPRFEEQVEMLTKQFDEELEADPLLICQTYDTIYGPVYIRHLDDMSKAITLSDIYNYDAAKKEGNENGKNV